MYVCVKLTFNYFSFIRNIEDFMFLYFKAKLIYCNQIKSIYILLLNESVIEPINEYNELADYHSTKMKYS